MGQILRKPTTGATPDEAPPSQSAAIPPIPVAAPRESDEHNVSTSTETLEERIRTRAYELWERDGRPDGHHDRHWSEAEQEVRADGPSEGSFPASDTPAGTGVTGPGSATDRLAAA